MSDPNKALYARRVFWILFITKRAYALQRNRPLTLQDSIALPCASAGPESLILTGLFNLISLFRNFDRAFMDMWNASNYSPCSASHEYPSILQQALDLALRRVKERTAGQQADLLLSREWLKLVVWQLCLSKTLLSDSSMVEESMSLHSPVSVARNVVLTTSHLPVKALDANGVGILEKIFDVGCSLADVLSLEPSYLRGTALKVGPGEYLREIVHIVGTAMGGSPCHSRVLAWKVDKCFQSSTLHAITLREPT